MEEGEKEEAEDQKNHELLYLENVSEYAESCLKSPSQNVN